MGKHDGKIALVTGSAHGIGKATARRLTADGATVVVADRDIAAAETLVAELGGNALAIEFDARSEDSIKALVQKTIDTLGRIDILHNNVGVTVTAWTEDKTVTDTPVEMWDMIFDINVRAHFLTSKYAIPHMIKNGGGAIINTASVGGLGGAAGLTSYCVSKAAVVHLTKCMAVQYGRDGIRTNCIAPGTIRTKQLLENSGGAETAVLDTLPFSRAGEPEDIANAVSFLASDDASFINGDIVPVDGGGMAGPAPSLKG